jgi:hypothetical protein
MTSGDLFIPQPRRIAAAVIRIFPSTRQQGILHAQPALSHAEVCEGFEPLQTHYAMSPIGLSLSFRVL